ncbi:hypothetical protein EGW08_003102 [Elysia chlorotica]|uniref:Cationic amino acid transporter C-terminal domain-containing protein n=1 Tax=Elysia chlorotica TaxID=188477 RepID=A0A3S1BUN2_ELYCH|nr:hypothetical protein EGW08_003102 [Elysia chlorotica]
MPRCGSGYTFCYVTLGELLAFVVGWSLVLEQVLMGAAAAQALWQYVDYMYNSTGGRNVTALFQLPNDQDDVLNTSPDFFSCCVAIAAVFLTFISIKRCATVHLLLIFLCALVLLAFICVGFFHVEAENWNSNPGFFAHGIGGIVSGAALLMSTFSGVDTLSSCSEEAKTPSKSLPSAFSFTLALVFTSLFLVTVALTLASPWQQLADDASLARAFETHGIFAANFVIGVGAVAGLLPVLIGSFLVPVKILYAMSEDNLLPKIFSKIGYNGVPVCAHFVTGTLIAACSLALEFSTVLQMSSIALLIEFTASAIIVLLIRYQPSPVGISREYSDLDGSYGSYEDIADCQDLFEFRQGDRPKLVILPQDDNGVSGRFGYGNKKYEPNLFCSATGMSEDRYSDKKIRQTTEFQRCAETGSYQSFFDASPASSCPSPSARPLANGFKRKETVSAQVPTAVYGERDRLKNAAYDSNGFTQHKSYGTDMDSHSDMTRYSACGDSSITEGNNNCSKKRLQVSGDRVDSKSKELGDPGDPMVRKLSLTCNLRGSGTEVSLRRGSSAASSLVNLGSYEADEATWRRARYFLLVYIAASTCLAVLTQVWPTRSADSALAQQDDDGMFSSAPALAVHAHPAKPDHVSHSSQNTHHRQSFGLEHEHRQKVFDPRIEEGGHYDVLMPGGSSSSGAIDCADPALAQHLSGAWWAVLLLCSSLLAMLVSGLCIAKQPQNRTALHFKTPYVPLVPLLALSGNMLLLGALPVTSWARFALWTLAGLFVYFGYSQRHSRHRRQDEQDVVLFDISQLPTHEDPNT